MDRVEHRKQKQLLGGTASEKLKLREPQTTNTRYSSTSTQRAVRRELIKMLEKTSARSSVTLYESMEVLGKLVRADIRKASDTLREQGHKSVALALEMVAERVSNRIEPRDARDILAAAIQVVRAVD